MSPPLVPFLGIWITGMVAMMLPPLVPVARLVEHVGGSVPRFLAGYLLVWSALGFAAYAALRALDGERAATIVALVAAGLYQLAPLKRTSLLRCRSPFVALRRPPFAAGLRHAVDCAGCCAGLMLVLAAVGSLSVLWMAIVAAAIFVEKATSIGPRVSAPLAAAIFVVALVNAL